jgi:hypothetical protein
MIRIKSLDSILYKMEMEGKRARQRRDRERVSVWEAAGGGKGEIASIIKWAVREIHLVGIKLELISKIPARG